MRFIKGNVLIVAGNIEPIAVTFRALCDVLRGVAEIITLRNMYYPMAIGVEAGGHRVLNTGICPFPISRADGAVVDS